jgi:hypothetical protein
MKTETLARNPFMLMLSPDVVLAAVERSEKLGRLNRRLCQPLDRLAPPASPVTPAALDPDEAPDRP